MKNKSGRNWRESENFEEETRNKRRINRVEIKEKLKKLGGIEKNVKKKSKRKKIMEWLWRNCREIGKIG